MPEEKSPQDRWDALLRITRSWRLEWGVDRLLARLAREAVDLLGLDRGLVLLLGSEGLTVRAIWPEVEDDNLKDVFYSEKVALRVVEGGRSIFSQRVVDESSESEERVVFCVPLAASRGVLGVLYVEARESSRQLTYKDQEFLEMLSMHAAVALEHALFHHAAVTDSLTGLFSHRHFQGEVEQEIRRSIRTAQPVSLILLDLDHFKEINDSLGHEIGNQTLIDVAAVLRENLRSTDTLGRFGGDEFEILLPGVDITMGHEIGEKIRRAIGTMKFGHGKTATASFGIASYPLNALNAKALFLRADAAMYQAKEAGRDCGRVSPDKEDPLPLPEAMRGQRLVGEAAGVAQMQAAAAERLDFPALPEALEAPTQGQVDGHPVVRRLGIGATSEVLLVIQPDLGREVALKKLKDTHSRPEQVEAFEKEARLTASLEHPGVITVHGLGRDLDGRRYYTMKHIHGLSLEEIMKGRRGGDADLLRKFTLNRLIECLQRVCEAVAYAHEREVAHLDLNPTNIIVGGFGEVTVIDWSESLSSLLGRPTAGGEPGTPDEAAGDKDTESIVIGTPTYAAPEQLPGSDGKEGCPSDIHALGAILYEMLTDRPPYVRDTIEGTIEALRRGIVTPPDVVSPYSGIDPTLSDLCVRALDMKPARRPDAVEFAESLGRYVRSEAHWEVVKFGSDEHPLVEDEWTTVLGEWHLDGDTWVAGGSESILVWNVPLHGGHRFICEGWVEGDGELSLVTHGPSPELAGGNYYRVIDEGYFFEFGAEFNTCTKLTRRGHDVMAKPGLVLESGRKYRIEVSYQDGWLHCFLDGKLVFEYRELFPLTGCHVGFYGYGTSTHLRPIELHRETWGLKAPVMRTADDLLRRGYHDAALEQYSDIAGNIPHRLEGDEARLKKAMCLVRLGSVDEAREQLRGLAGTQLEPFALAEEAMLEFRGLPELGDPDRGVECFHRLQRKFPESQAKSRVLEVVRDIRWKEYLKAGNTLTQNLELRAQTAKLASTTFEPPVLSQIFGARVLAGTLMSLGRWNEALEELVRFRDKLHPEQHVVHGLILTLIEAAMANGREDLVPQSGGWKMFWNHSAPHRCLDIVIHPAVRKSVEWASDYYEGLWDRIESADSKDLLNGCKRHLLWCLTCGDLEGAERTLKLIVEDVDFLLHLEPYQFMIRNVSYIITESRQERLMKMWMKRMSEETESQEDELRTLMLTCITVACRARWELEGGDMAGAAGVLEGMALPPRTVLFTDGLLFQVMLSSLGALKSPGMDELADASELLLAGTSLDLARMFRGEKDPAPNELWPHHLFHPEWRLWLALWLEARGDKDAAREIAESARDPRYGMAHCQPAIEELLKRVG